jgi:hypothetical protein
MTSITPASSASKIVADILTNGGGTRSIVVGVPVPTTGYAVSLPGHEVQIPKPVRASEGARMEFVNKVRTFIFDRIGLLSQPQYYVGAWVEGDTVYLDVTRVFAERVTAELEGHAANQVAIYDLAKGESIYRVVLDDDPDDVQILWLTEPQRDALYASIGPGEQPSDLAALAVHYDD